ncbi:hypothetical protein [Escherichia phage C6]|nr:hypothetical protein [Escherichia phage C6]
MNDRYNHTFTSPRGASYAVPGTGPYDGIPAHHPAAYNPPSPPVYVPPATPYENAIYLVAFLTEAGTQDRGCQRSGLLTELEAHKRAREWVLANPKGEAIVTKAVNYYTAELNPRIIIK